PGCRGGCRAARAFGARRVARAHGRKGSGDIGCKRMKITGVETFLMAAGPPGGAAGAGEGAAGTVATATGLPFGTMRHWLFVEVHTDAGVTGVGEGSGWPLVVEAAVRDLAHVLIGEDPAHIERLWLKLRAAMA